MSWTSQLPSQAGERWGRTAVSWGDAVSCSSSWGCGDAVSCSSLAQCPCPVLSLLLLHLMQDVGSVHELWDSSKPSRITAQTRTWALRASLQLRWHLSAWAVFGSWFGCLQGQDCDVLRVSFAAAIIPGSIPCLQLSESSWDAAGQLWQHWVPAVELFHQAATSEARLGISPWSAVLAVAAAADKHWAHPWLWWLHTNWSYYPRTWCRTMFP